MIKNKIKKKELLEENQNIEYKINWRDEYLKWICGFARNKGGIKS